MVAEVLNEHPDNTKALIDTYSKWFNSPEPGKYVLYHDRLRTYLLQKLSDHEIQDLNETLISYLEKALLDEKGDESELYALEHLATHMLVESQLGNNYERLHEFVNHEDLWEWQINKSNEYKWSQRALQYGIKEAARKHKNMELLGLQINAIILQRKEENDLSQILNLYRNRDLDIAFKRINSVKQNKRLKIILALIHELINEKSVRIEVLDEIIKSLEQIETDYIEMSYDNEVYHTDTSYEKYPCRLIISYIAKIIDLNIDCKPLINKVGINGSDLILLKKNSGISGLNLSELKLVSKKLFNTFYEIIFICLLVKASKKKDIKSKNIVLNNIDFLGDYTTINYYKDIKTVGEISNSIDDDYLKQRFLKLTTEIFKNFEYYDNSFRDDPNIDSYRIHENPIEEILDIITNYKYYLIIDDEILYLIESKINRFKHSKIYINILVKLKKFQRALEYIFNNVNTDKFGKKDEFNNELNYDIEYCSIVINLHKNNSSNGILEIINYIKSENIKSLCFLGIASNFLNIRDITNAENFFKKSHSLALGWKDYNNGQKFSVKSLKENLILIGLFICYFKKKNEYENIINHVNEFIKINSLLSNDYFKNHDNINRVNFINTAQIIRVCENFNIGNDVIGKFKSELINSINLKCESYHDLKYVIEELTNEIYLEVLSLFPKIWDGSLPKIVCYTIMLRLVRTFKDLKNILKNDEIKFSHEFIEYLKDEEFDRIIKFTNEKTTSTVLDLKDTLNDGDFEKMRNSFQKYKSFDIKYFLNSLIEKSIPLEKERSKFKALKAEESKGPINQDYFKNNNEDYDEKLIEEIIRLNSLNYSELEDHMTELEINNLFEQINKFTKNQRSFYSLPIIGLLLSINFDKYKKLINYTDKQSLLYSISLSSLINNGIKVSPLMKSKMVWKFNNSSIDSIKSFRILKSILIDLLLILPDKDMGNYNNISDEILEIVRFLIYFKKTDLVVEATNESCIIFNYQTTKSTFRSLITGIVVPRDVCFLVWEDIFKELLKSKFYNEALVVSKQVKEKNKISRLMIQYIEVLLSNNLNIPNNFITEIIELIESADDIPIDHIDYSHNHKWPEKGYSYLDLAEFYNKINEPNKSKSFVQRALKEINLNHKNYDLELNCKQEYKTRINLYRLDQFKSKCVDMLLDINEIEDAISLSETIDSKSGYFDLDFFGIKGHFDGSKGNDLPPYPESRKNISNYYLKINNVNKAISYIILDDKIPKIGKGFIIKEVASKISYFDFIKFNTLFLNKKLEPFFINILIEKLNFSENEIYDFMFVSRFGKQIFEGVYDNQIKKDVMKEYIEKKCKVIINENDLIKTSIVAKAFEI